MKNKIKKILFALFILSIPTIYKYNYVNNTYNTKYNRLLDYFNNMDIIEKNLIKMYTYSYPQAYIAINMLI